jgi:hypothetical protein
MPSPVSTRGLLESNAVAPKPVVAPKPASNAVPAKPTGSSGVEGYMGKLKAALTRLRPKQANS